MMNNIRTAIVTMVKNEHLYLKEWIDYHLNLGIDAIYIVEDCGSVSHKLITDEYNNVKIHRIAEFGLLDRNQILVNLGNIFISRLTDEYDWIAFIDVDEFITLLDKNTTLKDALQRFESNILMMWHNFNANGHFYKPTGSVLDCYTTECNSVKSDRSLFITKAFAKTSESPVLENVHWTKNACLQDNIYIRHYITKSFEEFCHKIYARGDIYDRMYRGLNEFLQLNPDFDEQECIKYIKDKYGDVPLNREEQ